LEEAYILLLVNGLERKLPSTYRIYGGSGPTKITILFSDLRVPTLVISSLSVDSPLLLSTSLTLSRSDENLPLLLILLTVVSLPPSELNPRIRGGATVFGSEGVQFSCELPPTSVVQ